MYNNDSIYADMDLFSTSNRLFAFNDTSNIWSSEKLISMDFTKQKSLSNNNPAFMLQDRFARNRKPPGDRRDTNLIVNYLPDGFYEKELFDLFSQAGPIVHHHVVRNKDNRSECYGFVDFEKSSDADKAIEMFHQYPIQNKKLKVQNAAEGLLIKEEERHRAIKCITNVGYNVEVKNAPIRWTINDVKSVFGKYGEMLKVYESVSEDCENVIETKSKTFNIIYRYHAIAMKVVKKRNKTSAEALWPLDLELSITGQEVFEPSSKSEETNRRRNHNKNQKLDQMSESSWENKAESIFYSSNNNFENPINYWSSESGTELTSNGRPILKHINNQQLYEQPDPFFGDCNDLKAIWSTQTSQQSQETAPSDIYVRTPLVPSRFHRGGDDSNKATTTTNKASVWFKMENMQPSGSFKLRGMATWCCRAKQEGISTVVSSSGGNAGLAAAYACRVLRMRCIVYVPLTTPVKMVQELLREGAEVLQEGSCWREAHERAEARCAVNPKCRLCHPYDNVLLWLGYESLVEEVIEDMQGRRVDMIVVAVGGGGLLNGVLQAVGRCGLSRSTAVLAMETEGCGKLNRSIQAGQVCNVVPSGVATSLGATCVSARTWELYCGMEYHLFSKTCSDLEAVDACCQFLNEQNCLVEPACGAALSVVYNGTLDKMAECRNSDLNIVVVVCGGRCIEINNLLETRQHLIAMATQQQQTSFAIDLHQSSISDQFGGLSVSVPPLTTTVIDKDVTPFSNYSNLPSSRNYAAAVLAESTAASNISSDSRKFSTLFGNRNSNNSNHSLLDNGSNILAGLGAYQQHHRGYQQHHHHHHHGNYSSMAGTAVAMDGGDVPSPVGSQHSDKENLMLLH